MRFPQTLRWRAAVLAVTLLAVAAAATVAGGDRADRAYRDHRSPRELAKLLVDGHAGGVLGAETGSARGAGRLAGTGRGGRRPGNAAGVSKRRGGSLAVVRARGGRGTTGTRRGSARGRTRTAPEARRTPGASPAPGGGDARADDVVVGIAYVDPESITRFYARYGAVIQATNGGIQAQAVADAINGDGGIGGRRIVLRTFRDDPTDSRPIDAHLQGICSFFADGPRPVAVIAAADRALLAPCLASKGLPLITNGPTTASSASFARYPDHLFAPGSLAMDRFAAPYVRGLKASGFFGRGARVGLLHFSDSDFDPAADALRTELDRAGIRIAAQAKVPFVRSTAEAGAVVTHAASAIVRFRLANVNRVVSVDHSGALMTLFMLAAEPQGFRPLYGLSTLNAPMFLRASVPPRQLHGAVGIGWMPSIDVPGGRDDDVSATRARCAEIYRRAGVAVGDRSPYGQFSAFSYCDSLLLLTRALPERGQVPPPVLRAAIEGLGTRHPSALTFSASLSPSYHDGAAGYRLLRYETGCGCFRYEGPVYSLR